jgi:hypothetical protein
MMNWSIRYRASSVNASSSMTMRVVTLSGTGFRVTSTACTVNCSPRTCCSPRKSSGTESPPAVAMPTVRRSVLTLTRAEVRSYSSRSTASTTGMTSVLSSNPTAIPR